MKESAAANNRASAPEPKEQKKKASKSSLTGPQKAAAVVVALGSEKASNIYKYLDSDEVETLTLEVARLGYLGPEETEEFLGEFYRMCLTNKVVTEGGLEDARSVLEKAYGQQTADDLLTKLVRSLKNREFVFLSKADVKTLFTVLNNERAQTIAFVLSYVDADKAAGVIAQLDQDKQIRVVKNMANIENVAPAAAKIVEAEMSKKFSSMVTSSNVKVGGIDYVADIMNNLDRQSEKNIFDGLTRINQELAEEIRKKMFVFEDIVTMDDRSVQRFIRDCDPRDIVLALKGSNHEVAEKLYANMSERMAQSIQDDLEITTNVRLKDAEEAQQRIVGIIRGLEEKGELIIIKGGKDDIIA